MVKKAKYTPLERVDVEEALRQAVSALDIAAQLAIESKDILGLIQIAEAWVDIAAKLSIEPDEEIEESEELAPLRQIGFGAQLSQLEVASSDNKS